MSQKRFRTLVAAFLCLLGSAALRASEPVVIGQTERLHSAVLDEDRTYHVALPASYRWATDRRYPVLYVLDGAWHFQHAAKHDDPDRDELLQQSKTMAERLQEVEAKPE